MKYTIGYQLSDEQDSTLEIARDFQDSISGIYCAPAGSASARSAIPADAQEDMLRELRAISDLGIPITLLFNANCYGGNAISPAFAEDIVRQIASVAERADLREITTASPFVARVVKQHFPALRVCASVNLWIGTPQAMEALGDDFDAYYMQREFNRDFEQIRRLKAWCEAHGKELKLLANSGCLYACAFHTFHDNLVAHESEIVRNGNAMSKHPSPCWDYMHARTRVEAAAAFLRSSWIRPEDIRHYEDLFAEMKLATRMHSNARRVVLAYTRQRFHGNLLDLTEPSFSRRFVTHILDAQKCPEDWFEQTSRCGHRCEQCNYCLEAAKKMLTSKQELLDMYCSGTL